MIYKNIPKLLVATVLERSPSNDTYVCVLMSYLLEHQLVDSTTRRLYRIEMYHWIYWWRNENRQKRRAGCPTRSLNVSILVMVFHPLDQWVSTNRMKICNAVIGKNEIKFDEQDKKKKEQEDAVNKNVILNFVVLMKYHRKEWNNYVEYFFLLLFFWIVLFWRSNISFNWPRRHHLASLNNTIHRLVLVYHHCSNLQKWITVVNKKKKEIDTWVCWFCIGIRSRITTKARTLK